MKAIAKQLMVGKCVYITKYISSFRVRHNFVFNILSIGANIKAAIPLLEYSGLKHTETYTRVVDKLKSEAINSLPELKIKMKNELKNIF